MKKQDNSTKITALYERLSKDDNQKDISVSIAHQKKMLEDFAKREGFRNPRHFVDDGVTGTVFNRPGLNAMVEEIKKGNVATVIIKDQSRIGRDVVEVGLLKRTFEDYDVRFIAAEDGLDTAKGFNIMSLFKDVMNEWFVADTSRKIMAVFESRMEEGKRCSGSYPYGFIPDYTDKEKKTLLVDEDAAAVVRRIFQSVIDGKSIAAIGKELRSEQVPIPSEHWKRIGEPVRAASYADPYAWSNTTIGNILSKPEYKGQKILGKTVSESYKKSKNRKTAPEEQQVFDGGYPVIIDEETWDTVQRLRETKRRKPKRKNAPHRLTGLLYCADCNSKMTHRNNVIKDKWVEDAFICGGYRQLHSDCSMHYIPSANVEKVVLTAIQRVSWYVREHEDDFIQRVRKAYQIQQEDVIKDSKKQLAHAKKRYSELDGFIKKLYESNATGKISDKHFERFMADYDNEQTALESTMAELQGKIDSWHEDSLKTDMFIELAKRYTDFTELTTSMLNEFVERIVVHEGSGRGDKRRMRVDVHFSFIGDFEVPANLVSPAEKAEQKRLQKEVTAKNKLSRELSRERYEQRKAEKREFTARKKAGLLTSEEVKADEQHRAKRRAQQKQWRDNRKAADEQTKPAAGSNNQRGKNLTDGAMPLPAGM